jgi:hypothetical protein
MRKLRSVLLFAIGILVGTLIGVQLQSSVTKLKKSFIHASPQKMY